MYFYNVESGRLEMNGGVKWFGSPTMNQGSWQTFKKWNHSRWAERKKTLNARETCSSLTELMEWGTSLHHWAAQINSLLVQQKEKRRRTISLFCQKFQNKVFPLVCICVQFSCLLNSDKRKARLQLLTAVSVLANNVSVSDFSEKKYRQ